MHIGQRDPGSVAELGQILENIAGWIIGYNENNFRRRSQFSTPTRMVQLTIQPTPLAVPGDLLKEEKSREVYFIKSRKARYVCNTQRVCWQ